MKLKVLAFSILSALTLSACGSDSNDSKKVVTEGKDITVIDGYLAGVSVYADRNSDGVTDESELIGVSDDNGIINIPAEDTQYSLIAKVEAGVSADADRVGAVTKSYSMSAPADMDVITPFTTILNDGIVSVAELAASLNVDETLITGDYIAAKEGSEEAQKAHAVAKYLTDVIAEDDEMSSIELVSEIVKVTPAIDEYINTNGIESLDSVTFSVENDEVVANVIHTDLNDYLADGGIWHIVSMNKAHTNSEGVQLAYFNKESSELTLYDAQEIPSEPMPYTTDGTRLEVEGDFDQFYILTHDIALSKAGQVKDVIVWSKSSLFVGGSTLDINVDEFSGKQWYVINDDSTSSTPDNIYAKFNFGETTLGMTSDVAIDEGAEAWNTQYSIAEKEDEVFGIHKSLTVQLGDEDEPLEFIFMAESESLKVAYEVNRGMYFVLTTESSIAQTITN